MPANALVCEVCLATGLRIDDVLDLRTKELAKTMTVTEQKTRKKKRVTLSADLLKRLQAQAGKYYVFEHRDDVRKHRTRQAVYLDIKRAGKCFRLPLTLSPHSLRKAYAVELLKKTGDLEKVKKALNHDNEVVTMIYAFSDIYTAERLKKKGKKR
jgi:integrase